MQSTILNMHVSRPDYYRRLGGLLGEFPAVALLGPRQCGKTTLAKDILAASDRPGLYLDLERPRDLSQLADPDLFLSGVTDHLVCLDEIQRLPDLFPTLRGLIDDEPRPGRFLLLGSASPDLIRQSSESLAGRMATVALSPFTHDEVVPAHADLETHWLRGGYPRSLLASGESRSVQWREAFIAAFLERDLALMGIRTPPEAMGRFWRMVAHHHGTVLNQSALANALDVSQPTIRTRIDSLVGTFMLRVLPPLFANIGKRLVKSPKIYVRDSGLLHTLLDVGDRGALFAHPAFGASWEGYVVEQALTVSDRWRASFYRTANGVELDLVLERGQRRIAIECKASSAPSPSRGFWNALSDLGISEAYIVAPVARRWEIAKGVHVIPPSELRTILDMPDGPGPVLPAHA